MRDQIKLPDSVTALMHYVDDAGWTEHAELVVQIMMSSVHPDIESSIATAACLPYPLRTSVAQFLGEVLTGASVKDGDNLGWSVNVQADGDAQGAFDEAVRLLEGAGFDLVTEIQAGLTGGQLDNGTWSVVVAVYGDPSAGSATVGYTVGTSTR